MLAVDLSVGDIVTRVGDSDHRYLVTSTRPSRGLQNYVTIMGPYGHADDVWVNYVDKKIGHINIDYIFEELRGGARMSDKEFQDAIIEGVGDLSGAEFEKVVNYISEKLGVNKEELLK